ncbi:MAG: hypothetical protein LBR80_11510 [Deltaproteobacteria bacterium]|nr:hypothetical protein [Deltaproteobacteria bacterium]
MEVEPLTVLWFAPSGPVGSLTQAAVTFSQPMVEPEELGDIDRSLLTTEPPLSGKSVWVDRFTLAFVPDEPVTESPVTFRLSPEIRSLSGARLDGPGEFVFTVPALALEDVSQTEDFTPESAARPRVDVTFNRQVDPDSVNGRSFFAWGPEPERKRVPARWRLITGHDADPGRRFHVQSVEDIPPGKDWTLLIAKGASLVAGFPPIDEDFEVVDGSTPGPIEVTNDRFGYRGRGLHHYRIEHDLPPGSVRLEFRFSNPVRMSEAISYVEMEPHHAAADDLKVGRPGPASFGACGSEKSAGDRAAGEPDVTARRGEEPEKEPILSCLRLQGSLASETYYSVTFRKGLPDVYGNKLDEDRVYLFRTGRLEQKQPEKGKWPRAELDTPGGILESALPPVVPVQIVNMPEARFFGMVMGVRETVWLLCAFGIEGFWEWPHSEMYGGAKGWLKSAHWPGPGVHTAAIAIEGDLSRKAVLPLNLSELTGGTERDGVTFVGAGDGKSFSFFQVTDLALTAKIGATGSLAWVTRLSDGKPVAGAEVTVIDCAGSELWTGETGEDGLARFPETAALASRISAECRTLSPYRPTLHFTAAKGAEQVLWSSEWLRGFLPDEAGVAEALVPLAPGWAEGFLVANRPTNRPGEAARFKAVVRLLGTDGISLPEASRVRAVVRDPGGRVGLDRTVEMSPYGTVAIDVAVPPDAADGEWQVILDLDPSKRRSPAALAGALREPDVAGPMGFSVRRAPPLPFEMSLRGMHDAFAGDRMSFSLKAAFPDGTPLDSGEAGFGLGWRVDWGYRPPGFGPEWSFTARDPDAAKGLSADDASPVAAADGRSFLAADGTASFEAVIPDSGPPAPRAFVLVAKAEEPGGQSVGKTGRFTAHPASLYAGLSAAGRVVEVGKAFPLKVIAVGVDGVPVPGARIRVSLYRRTWPGGRRLTPGGFDVGLKYFDRLVSGQTVTTGEAPVEITLTPLEAGRHYVTAEVRDSADRMALARQELWVSATGDDGDADGPAWPQPDDGLVELVADADRYVPGNVAKILVQSPFADGTGLLTIERGGVSEARVFDLAGGAPVVEIPVSEADAPSVRAAVLLVRGRTAPPSADGEDPGRPAYRRGYLTLKVNAPPDRLAVEVVPADTEASVGALASVKVKVTDSDGRPFADCEIALAVVDADTVRTGEDGIFRPETLMRRELPLRVQTASSLGQVLAVGERFPESPYRYWSFRARVDPEAWHRRGAPLGMDKAMDPQGDGIWVKLFGEMGFETTVFGTDDSGPFAHFFPAVKLDENGEGEASFILPDYACELKVFAVAIGKDRATATGEAEIRVTRPQAFLTPLPEALTVGD